MHTRKQDRKKVKPQSKETTKEKKAIKTDSHTDTADE